MSSLSPKLPLWVSHNIIPGYRGTVGVTGDGGVVGEGDREGQRDGRIAGYPGRRERGWPDV